MTREKTLGVHTLHFEYMQNLINETDEANEKARVVLGTLLHSNELA